MQKLVIVRHGHYDKKDQLSADGKEQIYFLTEQLGPHLDGGSLLILSSTADRAWQSAEILAEAFNVPYEKHEILLSDEDHFEDLAKALELVQSREEEADVIILVTHHEYAKYFPYHYAKHVFDDLWEYQAIDKGDAWIIDCQDKTRELISQWV